MQQRIPFSIPTSALVPGEAASTRFVAVDRFVPLSIEAEDGRVLQSVAVQAWREMEGSYGLPVVDTGRPGDDREQGHAASDFGLLFKERTRITPLGFALGEHVLSLSLAPGEEVTLEQKAFSQREVTYDEASEASQELDTELSSTFSTEVSNQLQNQLSETRQTTFDIGGQVGGNVKGVDISVSPKWSNSVTNADTNTRTESVKQSSAQSQKVTAKFRAQHKISMKVAETSRYESTSKRVLRNPNSHTPVDLMYFKVLQRLRFSQERYGVRLCWAPFIPDPGVLTDAALAQAKLHFEALYALGELPPEPQRPKEPGQTEQLVELGWLELTDWGFPWGDMRKNYAFTITAPANHHWDGNVATLSASVEHKVDNWGDRGTPSIYVVVAASDGAGGVNVTIHGGVDGGGPGAHLYVNCKARFVSNGASADPAHVAAVQAWQVAHAEWQNEVDTRKAERAAKIEAALTDWRRQFWRDFDPAMAAMQLLVSTLFPASSRDESWEVDAWSTYFEFESGAIKLYPAWWSDKPMRDPQSGPESFQNASWARVFLPVRPGYEREALTWLVERRIFTQVTNASVAATIDRFLDELNRYRSQHFGGAEELALSNGGDCPDVDTPFLCLGQWEDTLPTDGTHLEVLQANTTAVDDRGEATFDSAQQLVRRRAELVHQQGELTGGVNTQVATTAPTVGVQLHVGHDEGGQ